MAVILRSLVLLGATGASFALFVQELLGDWLVTFISANTLSLANRTRVLTGMVAGALIAMVAGAILCWEDPRRAYRLARVCAPGILLGLIPPLLMPPIWPTPLNVALVMAAVLLLGERLYRMAIEAATETPAVPGGRIWRGVASIAGELRETLPALFPPRFRRWVPLTLVLLGVVGYSIYMSVFTLRMHGRFQTYNYDLGQYDNIFWSTLHGYPLRDEPLNLTKNWHELRNHAELSVFFFLPFYAIKPGGAILLVIQSCVIGLGAIPLYRFAARKLPRAYAVVIAYVYLFYPPTHGMQFYDFHFQPIAASFVLAVIDFIDERRYWLCSIAFLVAIGCREDIPVGLAILGTFLALSGYRVRAGLVLAAAATTYFVLMRFVIMPAFGSWYFQGVYEGLLPEGAPNFGGIIATMVSNPIFTFVSLLTADKLRYMLQILLPLAFLPIRRSYLVLSIIPGSIFTILTTKYPPTIDIGFQYSAHFIPYIFSAAVLALAANRAVGMGLVRRRAALATVVTGSVLCGVFWGAIPPRAMVHGGFSMMPMRAPTAAERQKHKDLRELHDMIPKDATAALSESEMTHVSRLHMRGLRDTIDADYLLYATGSGYGGSSNGDRALASGEFEKVAERPGLMLLRRKATTQPHPATPPPAPSAPAPTPAPAARPEPPPPPATPPPRNVEPAKPALSPNRPSGLRP
jgi:uncharacterized membrane protein